MTLTADWQPHGIEFTPDRDCEEPTLVFDLPRDRTGTFSITEPHLAQIDPE